MKQKVPGVNTAKWHLIMYTSLFIFKVTNMFEGPMLGMSLLIFIMLSETSRKNDSACSKAYENHGGKS